MTRRSVLWVTAAALALSQASVAGSAAEDGAQATEVPAEGLLLGVRSPSGLATVLVDANGKIDELGAGIAVPRPWGWWLADVVRDGLLLVSAAKLGAKCPLEADHQTDLHREITFIGPNHFSAEESTSEPGGAHSMESRHLVTRKIDSLGSLPVSYVLDSVQRFQERGEELYATDNQNREQPDVWEWGVVRAHGEWKIRGALQPSNETGRGTLAIFVTDITAPPSFTGPTGYRGLDGSSEEAGLSDGFAPSKRFRVTLSKDGEIRAYRRSAKATAWTLAGQRRIDVGEVVMVQPVGAKNLERWRSEARALLARNPCRSTH